MSFTLLDPQLIVGRLVEQVPECEGIEKEVLTKISDAAENHLRQLLIEMSEIAGHRLEPLRMNPMYQQINDPRKQLKFVEEYKKKQTYQEAVDKEFKSNAKRFKGTNQESRLNRETNEAAIMALQGNVGSNVGMNLAMVRDRPGGQPLRFRPRTCRISLRDFLCLLDCKNSPESAVIRNHWMYGSLQDQKGSETI